MSRFTRFQKIVIGFIVFFTIFGFITKSMQDSNAISKLGYDGFTMLKYSLIDQPIKTIQNWTSDFSSLWEAKEENDELKKELSQQKLYSTQYQEQLRDNRELKQLLKMNDALSQYTKVNANVMKRDDSMWNSHITIDVGKNDGIKKDMAVVSSTGLIGRVESVNFKTSVVKLLSSEDREEKLSVKIAISDQESAEGILEYYDVNQGCFVINLFTNNEKVVKDMDLITSGLGGKYPSGIFIGKVEKVEEKDNKIGKTIFVKPGADFTNFNYVMVINQSGETQ